MTLNRSTAPAIQQAEDIRLHNPEIYSLSNGIKVHQFNISTQELIKVEFTFKAGSWYQDKPYIASFTNSLLKSGTRSMDSEKIAQELDFYGAYLENHTEKDNSLISLYTLTKHLKSTLGILEELVKYPVFPQHELEVMLQKQKQNLIVNKQKVSFQARENFNHVLYGSEHPYGRKQDLTQFSNVLREDLVNFHKDFLSPENCTIIIAGNVPDNMKSLLEDHFSDWQKGNPDLNKTHTIQRSEEWFHYFEKEDALQSAIRIGKPLFNRSHKDFTEMMVVNTILGGYFGSRLMNNIREDKGYTYGIGSAIASFNHSGYFFITSEVGADVTQNTLDEVNKEINILRDELVGQEELQLVRNYMIGSFMRSIDGPFALSDKYRILLDYNMNFDYYKNFIETVKTIKAERIMELAQIHFDPKSMYTIVAGKK